MQWIFWNFISLSMISLHAPFMPGTIATKIYHERRYNSCTDEYETHSQSFLWHRNNLAENKRNNFTKKERLVYKRPILISDLILDLKWKYIDLIYQNNEEYFDTYKDVDCFIQTLHKSNIRTAIHTAGEGNKFQLLHFLWKNRDPDIHAVVFGNISFLGCLLQQASDFDNHGDNYRKTAMYSKSFWILLPTLQEHVDEYVLKHSNLDNVLLIDLIEYRNGSDIYSLMWRKNFTRQFERRIFQPFLTKDNLQYLFPNSKFGFNGREFVSSTLEWEQYLTISEVNGKMVISGGICAEVAKVLSEALNFTLKVVKPKDSEWGNLNDNGNWTGIIGQVHRREVDFSMAPLSIQLARAEVVDYTIPFIFEHLRFMMRVSDPELIKWQIYMKPYSSFVYICIVISVCFCGVCVYIFENCFAMKRNRKIKIVDTLLYFYGAMILQAGSKLPPFICSRIVICSYWMACISLAAVYCGSLVANMAVTHTEEIYFNTLEDLVDQFDYKWGYNGGTSRDLIFKTSRLPVYNRLYDGTHKFYKTDADVLSVDSEVHIQKVANEKYVYISGYNQLNKKHCEDYRFVLSPEKFVEDKMAFAFPKGSPFTELFTKKLSFFNHQIQYIHMSFKVCLLNGELS